METANSVIKDVLQEVLVQASEMPIESVDFQFAVRYMNRFMDELAITVPLGYTHVSLPTDKITIPAGAISGLIANVALEILNSFDIQIGPTLQARAVRGLATMRKISKNTVKTRMPSTMPLGSGNSGNCAYTRKFYSGTESTILTEQNGSILLEDTTNE